LLAGARRASAFVYRAALGYSLSCGPAPPPAVSGGTAAGGVAAQRALGDRHPGDTAAVETQAQILAELRRLESARRRATDFAHLPTADQGFGADPYRLAALPGGQVLGLLRGSAELRLYSPELQELDRAPAPRRSSALAVLGDGAAFAAGELSSRVQRYEVRERLRADREIDIPGVHSLRALAAGAADVLYAASEESSALFVVQGASTPSPRVRRSSELGRGVQRLAVVGHYLVAMCLLDHALVLLELDGDGLPSGRSWRAEQDGPFWGVAGIPWQDGLLLAASGVEDHPLDRRIGSFGYIDSFLFVYRFSPSTGLRRELSLDASDQGVLTARALTLEATSEHVTIRVEGYGSPRSLDVELSPELKLSRVEAHESPPGSADVLRLADGRWLSANPLLDAWCLAPAEAGPSRVLPVASLDPRSPREKLGEALELTSLMAPANSSAGALSRFTCETCHFEAGIDGRIHHTGRGDILATTKPLRGLFNNRPYFSRALDPDLTQMVHNEFRAAGANSGQDPWFSLAVSEHAWLEWLGVPAGELSARELREALLAHFMLVTHPPNPRAQPARPWSEPEQQGAQLFREHCESCHQSRLVTDSPDTRVPFEAWHELIFSAAGPLVWARDSYEKTGIEPLVHPSGARVPSLRRVFAKYPYFTNGSVRSLPELLGAARWDGARFYHRAPDDSRRNTVRLSALTTDEQRALYEFLLLL
jgi:mono/diheme cytochrome c family protein